MGNRYLPKIDSKALVALLLVFTGIGLAYSLLHGEISLAQSFGGPTNFTFVAAGDWGFTPAAQANWSSIHNSGANFVLALGDLSYGQTSDQNWCNSFKSSLNDVELITGNHDSGESSGDDIARMVQSCPFTLGRQGVTIIPGSKPGFAYGYEYAFDYPAGNPIARFIMIAPGITFASSQAGFSETWSYKVGDAHYTWVGNTIDDARAKGIRWVIVASHKPCLTDGSNHACEAGTDIMNLLIAKKVDLWLSGHNHDYERSAQLAFSEACPSSLFDLTLNSFNAACVASPGPTYLEGLGTVVMVQGTGGESQGMLGNPCCSPQYFTAADASSFGYTRWTVTPSSITGQFVPTSGPFTDSFSIAVPPQATPSP